MLVRTSPSGLIEPCLPSTAERPPSGADCGPLETRKATLASLLRSCPPGARFNEHLKHDGEVVFRHACKLGLEGIVSKRLGSSYRSGKCKDWLSAGADEGSRRGLGTMSKRMKPWMRLEQALIWSAAIVVSLMVARWGDRVPSYFMTQARPNDT
jgi:hypothetical protein